MFFRCITADMAAILKSPFLKELPPVSDDSLPMPLASLRDLALMKLIAVNQRGVCKDFIDLKFIMENTGLSLEVLLQDLGRKYMVGEEIFFQIKKSLIYFDDAERDLNVNMYAVESGRFECLADDTWQSTKRYFKDLVMTGSPGK